jgi:dephospho-CoA kinase
MKSKTATPARKSPNVIALTGGIGSGKSSVARFFEKWGAAVVDADQLARAAVAPGTAGLQALTEKFGQQILEEDGQLDREKLGTIVFTDPASRKFVESVIHPIVRTMWLEKLELLKRNPMLDLIVYVVPLFFESGMKYPEVKKVLLVTSPEEARMQRITERDGLSPEAVRARMRAQLSDDEKKRRSDYVIENDSTFGELEARVRLLFSQLARRS